MVDAHAPCGSDGRARGTARALSYRTRRARPLTARGAHALSPWSPAWRARAHAQTHSAPLSSLYPRLLLRILLAHIGAAVPVIQYFEEHDGLFEGLPVVRVTDWTQVTPAFLDHEWARLQRAAAEGRIGLAKAYFPWWLAKYTARMGEPSRLPSAAVLSGTRQ